MHEVLGRGEGILKIPTWQVSVLCGHRTRGLVVFVFCFIFSSCCSYYVQLSYLRYIAKKTSSRQSDSQPGFSQWNIPTWRTVRAHPLSLSLSPKYFHCFQNLSNSFPHKHQVNSSRGEATQRTKTSDNILQRNGSGTSRC